MKGLPTDKQEFQVHLFFGGVSSRSPRKKGRE